MKRIRTVRDFAAAIALVALLSILGATSKHMARAAYAASGCSISTLTGNYGFTQTGFFNFSKNGGGGYAPTADVGIANFDGTGHFTAMFTDSTNGKITTGLSAPGTYTVDSNCTGTMTIVNVTSPGENANYTTVILGGGTEMMAISTNNEATQTVSIKKQ